MSDFLENLKKAADSGEFNSEAAKKINEISELAEGKSQLSVEQLDELVKKRVGDNVVEISDEEKTRRLEVNSEYEEKMENLKKLDFVNTQLATLIEIEDMIKLSIDDMFTFTEELDAKFINEFAAENPMYADLNKKITELKTKYKY